MWCRSDDGVRVRFFGPKRNYALTIRLTITERGNL